jgi:aminocarboxymuconate-semialdehyde decarboxylase
MGSDFPFDMGLDDPVTVVRSAGLPSYVTQLVLGENADALLESRVPA